MATGEKKGEGIAVVSEGAGTTDGAATRNGGTGMTGRLAITLLAALSLFACAAQSCLAGDMGAGGMFQILQCLQDKCPMQLDACHGLGITS